MEFLFNAILYLFLGFFGLIAVLIVFALLFGKRVVKEWEYEAEFHHANGREFGEFEIELSQIQKEEPAPSLKVKFYLRHEMLTQGQNVEVFLDDRRVIQGTVEQPGRIRIREKFGQGDLGDVSLGQQCRILVGGTERFSEPLKPED